ncbi:Rab5-interacting protein-domain-containing protein [Kockiozyma suomiensis]|uniref:Rab5-interacting protein-domain-containing protein n=1 Tax=Kockiozyma suomiensis TaxID=1337062 RepID=UPI00334312F2
MDSKERQLAIAPISTESLTQNTKAVYYIRSVSSTIFGVAAGILGLESYIGFLFYFAGTTYISLLMFLVLAKGKPSEYFTSSSYVWTGNAFTGLTSFVLTWTMFYGLVDA